MIYERLEQSTEADPAASSEASRAAPPQVQTGGFLFSDGNLHTLIIDRTRKCMHYCQKFRFVRCSGSRPVPLRENRQYLSYIAYSTPAISIRRADAFSICILILNRKTSKDVGLVNLHSPEKSVTAILLFIFRCNRSCSNIKIKF